MASLRSRSSSAWRGLRSADEAASYKTDDCCRRTQALLREIAGKLDETRDVLVVEMLEEVLGRRHRRLGMA